MHKVTVDRSHAIVCLAASGFLTLEDVARGAVDLHAAILSLGPRVGQHLTLYDFSEAQVAPGAVLDRFAGYFTDPAVRPLLARRVAFVAGSALFRLQLKRIGADNMRVFADREQATAWLLADQGRLRTISQPTAASG